MTITAITNPKSKIFAYWYKDKKAVRELRIHNSLITEIGTNAFNTPGFEQLIHLELEDMPVKQIKNGIFNGLQSLQSLVIKRFSLLQIDPKIFAPCPSIHYFQMFDSSKRNLRIDGLLGSVDMFSMKNVQFEGNALIDTISKRTFVGLRVVTQLNLPRNRIKLIGAKAFDPIANTLEYLNLQHNDLKTLPPQLFQYITVKSVPYDLRRIYLNDNLWLCDSGLLELQRKIKKYPRLFQRSILCKFPIGLRNQELEYVQLSPNGNISFTNDTNTKDDEYETTSISIIENVAILPVSNKFYFTCQLFHSMRIPVNVSLQKTNIHFHFHQMNSTHYEIYVNDLPQNHTLIGFENDAPLDNNSNKNLINIEYQRDMRCMTDKNNIIEHMRMRLNVKPKSVYRFCIMNNRLNAIKPLDCMSFNTYNTQYAKNSWIHVKYRPIIITFVIAAAMATIFIGICITFKVACIINATNSRKSSLAIEHYRDKFNWIETISHGNV